MEIVTDNSKVIDALKGQIANIRKSLGRFDEEGIAPTIIIDGLVRQNELLQRQNDELVARVGRLERAEAHYWWKLGMANARRLIKAHKSTSNQALMANLFGMGFGSAGRRCRDIGLEPSSNKSSLNDMHPFDGETTKQRE